MNESRVAALGFPQDGMQDVVIRCEEMMVLLAEPSQGMVVVVFLERVGA